MRSNILKLSAVVIVCLLAQGCMEDEVVPSVAPQQNTESAISSRADGRVKLQNAFWATVRPYTMEYPIAEILLYGREVGKKITVNWGDGTVAEYTFQQTDGYNGMSALWVTHSYATMSDFTISITGDLSNIVIVDSPLTTVEIFEINFDRLTNLEELSVGYNSIHTLNVSKNSRLKRLTAPASTLTQNVILPKHHQLEYVSSGSPNLSTAVVSAMIESVYRNAKTKRIYNGFFGLDTEMSEFPEFPGPPTAADMAKLVELRDVYGWTIFPNP